MSRCSYLAHKGLAIGAAPFCRGLLWLWGHFCGENAGYFRGDGNGKGGSYHGDGSRGTGWTGYGLLVIRSFLTLEEARSSSRKRRSLSAMVCSYFLPRLPASIPTYRIILLSRRKASINRIFPFYTDAPYCFKVFGFSRKFYINEPLACCWIQILLLPDILIVLSAPCSALDRDYEPRVPQW